MFKENATYNLQDYDSKEFFGNKTIKYVQGCNHLVVNPYNINQFNLFDIGKMFFENGFNFWCIKDNATGSDPKEIYMSQPAFFEPCLCWLVIKKVSSNQATDIIWLPYI